MVISFTQKRKNQKYLVLVFVALISLIAFVFLSGFFKKEEITTSMVSQTISKPIPKIEINFNVLENPIFKKLFEPFPDLPAGLPSGSVGRENPFLPYGEIEEILEE